MKSTEKKRIIVSLKGQLGLKRKVTDGSIRILEENQNGRDGRDTQFIDPSETVKAIHY